ncbi:MAG: hypothetical protein FJ295_09380 [Planctomycetes bacterium]|nr:hypothetical protein [Planctomycetota bacterium]
MSEHQPIRIAKIGGSLLDYPLLPVRFRDWIGSKAPARNLVVAGGGPFVESVREAQPRFHLSDAVCHVLCMELLNVTARLLYEILAPSVPCVWVGTEPKLRQFLNDDADVRIGIAATGELLNQIGDRAGEGIPALPESWEVTSDSLAIRLAIQLRAKELVLLKSENCPGHDWMERAALGYVDRLFPYLAVRFGGQIGAVNLRADPFVGS